MEVKQLRDILEKVAGGATGVEEALSRLRALPFEQLPFATLDHHRALRCGHPEVIFCPGKTVAQVVEIATRLGGGGGQVLATRGSAEQLAALKEAFTDAVINDVARAVLIHPPEMRDEGPAVAVVSAGTSDAPVAEEATITLRSMGAPVKRFNDVGISGLHRLLSHVEALQSCCAVVAVAGMEGALPSVVGGLVACPVFAVPTSVGYGANFGGLSALLTMINSCASNVSVVNIDNGFGAGYAAGLVWQQIERFAQK